MIDLYAFPLPPGNYTLKHTLIERDEHGLRMTRFDEKGEVVAEARWWPYGPDEPGSYRSWTDAYNRIMATAITV